MAGHAIWFYLGKLIWPHPLIFIYPRWQIAATQPVELPANPGGAGGTAFLVVEPKRGTAAGFLCGGLFCDFTFPVRGFFNLYFYRFSFVADHFNILPPWDRWRWRERGWPPCSIFSSGKGPG